MSQRFGTFLKNILPGLALVAIGMGGAYIVYETSFKDKVATGFAEMEPAAGYGVEVDTFGSAVDTSWVDGQEFPPVPEAVHNKPVTQEDEALQNTIQNIESTVE